jgi:hypothetical protein
MTGRFAAAEMITEWNPQPFICAPALQEAIDLEWAALDPNPHFNGRIARLDSWNLHGGFFHLALRPTDYKTLLFSNNHGEEIISRWGEAALARALGISAVVCSADRKIILMQRSDNVGEYPGCFDIFGGHIDVNRNHLHPDPFRSITTELEEELGLAEAEYDLTGIGLVEVRKTRKPELLFAARCALTSEEIVRRAASARDRFEYTRLLQSAEDRRSLRQFLSRNGLRTSPSAVGALEIYAAGLHT